MEEEQLRSFLKLMTKGAVHNFNIIAEAISYNFENNPLSLHLRIKSILSSM